MHNPMQHAGNNINEIEPYYVSVLYKGMTRLKVRLACTILCTNHSGIAR